jgi:hypothetical protein
MTHSMLGTRSCDAEVSYELPRRHPAQSRCRFHSLASTFTCQTTRRERQSAVVRSNEVKHERESRAGGAGGRLPLRSFMLRPLPAERYSMLR